MITVHIHIELTPEGEEFAEIIDRVKEEVGWAMEKGYIPEREYSSPRGYAFSIAPDEDEEGEGATDA